MTLNGARHTAHRTAAATVAASEARRRAAAGRLAFEMTKRLHLLADEELAAFAGTVVANCTMRGLTVPDLLVEEDEQRGNC